MDHRYQERAVFTTLVEKTDFWAEKEKFLKIVESLNRQVEKRFVLTDQLERLYKEIQLTKGDTRSLKLKLNHIAREFGISPIPIRRVNPATKRPGVETGPVNS